MMQPLFTVFRATALAGILLLFAVRCANPVMPLGGEKDFTPPQVVHAVPPAGGVNFTGRMVSITFDEFVKLDKINQQSLISPAPPTRPEYRIKGKTLQVRFVEDLFENTTYTLFFGNAIVDLTENNPIEGFNFVFSTGPVLDSMSLAGKVEFAFNRKPAEGVFVMLYRQQPDSIPLDSLQFRAKPYYVARSDKQGRFRFTNLRNEPYHLFAIEDKNNNLLYDKGSEHIAFADSLVFPVFKGRPVSDTAADTITSAAGRIRYKQITDSLYYASMPLQSLRMFAEVDSTQKLLRADVPRTGLLRFAFRYPAKDLKIKILDSLPEEFSLVKTSNPAGDTLLWYFRDGLADSLRLVVQTDTTAADTLRLALKPRQQAVRRTAQNEPANLLHITTNTSGQRLDPGNVLQLRFSEPVLHYAMRDTNIFIRNNDTLFNVLDFRAKDQTGLIFELAGPIPEMNENIRMIIPDSVFFGLNGTVNERTEISFKIPPLTEYGTIKVLITDLPHSLVIIQLVDPKDEVVQRITITEKGQYTFGPLRQGKYRLKAINDANGNKRWDTGDVVKRLQPEWVTYFEKDLDVRPNWDIEEEWAISF
ncbi:MAG: Ig-like domain-containing protein [Bacteroidetes bacterium]|nr:Ig-like domain-containing protein [Bacteroidota bacterium]